MRVILYQCSLCDNSWEEKNVFGINVEEDGAVTLVEPDDTEKHICANCMKAINDQLNQDKSDAGYDEFDEESGRGLT